MRLLKRFIRQFPGSSFPVEIETTEGEFCILKMRGAGNGSLSLVNELIVNLVCARAGWCVPDAFPVSIPEGFPWEFGTDEFDDIVQKSYGENLGIRMIPDARAFTPEGIVSLPESVLSRMLAIDILFCNYDRLLKSANLLIDAKNQYWLIDHGSCLFTDAAICARPPALAPNHCFRGQERKALGLIEEIANERLLREAIAVVPHSWLEENRLDPEVLLGQLLTRARVAASLS